MVDHIDLCAEYDKSIVNKRIFLLRNNAIILYNLPSTEYSRLNIMIDINLTESDLL